MKLLLLMVLTWCFKVEAFDSPYLLRSPKGLLMGDAFTAVNDDSFSQFYNPATLGRNKTDFKLYPFNPQINATNVFDDLKRFKNFPNEPVGASKVLMDYPINASAGIAPGFQIFNVGVTFLASESNDMLLRNQAHPMLDIDIHADKGLLLGIGIPVGSGRISKKTTQGSQTSIGLGAKYIERTGIRDTISFTGPTTLECLNQKKVESNADCLGKTKGIGWGFDAGIEHVIKNGNSQLVFGLAALDITDTQFEEIQNKDNLQVADIRNQINFGMAAGQNTKLFHYILSADIRALNEEMDFTKRLRLGAELGIPGISVMGGINSGYYSYGAMLDIGILKASAGLYDVEIGSKSRQIKSRRFVLYLSLFDFSFDA